MKNTRTVTLIATAFVSSALAFNAFAHDHKHEQDEHQHEKHEHEGHEHHGKHEHGVADMNIALDGKQLLVELTSPTANFLGFEHKPSTKAQKKAYAKLAKTLNKPSKVIDLDGGKCRIAKTVTTLPYDGNVHHDHDHDKHKDHDHEDHNESAHSDIEFKYIYTCKKPKSLEHVGVELFDQFKGFEKINVQWLANNKQGSATLTQKNTVVELHSHKH